MPRQKTGGRKKGTLNKGTEELVGLARVHTKLALETLVEIAKDKKGVAAARISASSILLDRGYGKPHQAHVGADGGSIVIEHIRRTVVDPDDQTSDDG